MSTPYPAEFILKSEINRLKELIEELATALNDCPKVGDTSKRLREKHLRDKALIQRAEEYSQKA